MLERFGIAFAGHYVYPRELALLARVVLPLPMKAFGRFLNAVGPFLADVPAAAQLTGVSDWALLPKLKPLVVRIANRRIWLSTNAIGADELISFVDNVVFCSGSSETFCIIPEVAEVRPGTPDRPCRGRLTGRYRRPLPGEFFPAAVPAVQSKPSA